MLFMARAGPPFSGWARCDEAAAAGPAAAPGLRAVTLTALVAAEVLFIIFPR